jgi:predicted RNase H-like HicB family nuclease
VQHQNPLIGATPQETLENAVEAIEALIALMVCSEKHSGLCRLMEPIVHAIEHSMQNTTNP